MAAAIKEVKQHDFKWEGTDRKGNKISGQMSGPGDAFVKQQLRKQGVTPTRVQKQLKFGSGKKAITGQDIAIFSRQMSTMMRAGVPLVQALDLVARGNENKSMTEMILSIKFGIESGLPFAESLAKHPRYFDDLYVNLVEAGEKSGALETLLDKIATYKEKTETIKKKVKKALTYPAAVVVVAFIVTGILLYFVIPQFEELFRGFGADLPAFTKMVVSLSKFVTAYWWMLLLIPVVAVFAFKEAHHRSANFRRFLDRIALKAPLFGDILYKSAVARFARTLSTMFAAGVPLVEAMDSVAKAAGNIVYTEGIFKMKDQVSTGTQLQLTMAQSNLFPAMAIQMIGIGEESGSLDAMCAKVADFYEEEVDNMVDSLSSLMEPMIMAFLGIIVGGLVTAMYLPIFKLGQAI